MDRKRIIIVVPTSSFVAHDSGRDGKFLRENCSFYETGHFFPYVYTDGLYWWFWVQIFLFFLFLAIYLFTLLGNVRLMLIVIGDSLPHNPMYSFLSALSFLDVCCSSVVTPKLVINFLSENKDISYLEKKKVAILFFLVLSHIFEVFISFIFFPPLGTWHFISHLHMDF